MSGAQVLFLATAMAGIALSQQVAQEPDEISPDRPGFGDSANVMGKRTVEVEGGFVRESSGRRADREVIYSAPLTTLRFGVSRRLELRFEGDGYIVDKFSDSSHTSGLSDHALGVKYQLHGDEGPWPTFALLGSLSFPVGSKAFTSGAVDPTVKLIWSKDLRDGFSVSGTFNFSSVSDADGRIFDHAFSMSVGHGLGKGLAGFWEVYREDLERGQGASWSSASGLTHDFGKNVQLDCSAGHTVTGVHSGWFLGAGFAFRHPHLILPH